VENGFEQPNPARTVYLLSTANPPAKKPKISPTITQAIDDMICSFAFEAGNIIVLLIGHEGNPLRLPPSLSTTPSGEITSPISGRRVLGRVTGWRNMRQFRWLSPVSGEHLFLSWYSKCRCCLMFEAAFNSSPAVRDIEDFAMKEGNRPEAGILRESSL